MSCDEKSKFEGKKVQFSLKRGVCGRFWLENATFSNKVNFFSSNSNFEFSSETTQNDQNSLLYKFENDQKKIWVVFGVVDIRQLLFITPFLKTILSLCMVMGYDVHYIFFKIQCAESYRPVHCAVNLTSPEVSRSYSEKVHKLDSSEIFLLFSSFFLLFCHAKFQMLFKVIHPKFYKHKEAAQNRHLGR